MCLQPCYWRSNAIITHEKFSKLFDSEILEPTKKCGMCKQHLPTSLFGRDGGANYLRYECKPCARKQSKIVNNLRKSAPAIPNDHRCPICEKNEEELREEKNNKNIKTVWCLDHNHKTNKFRGWLCQSCNLGIGNLKDSSEYAFRAGNYLKEAEEQK